MKLNITVDCSPEEARAFLGLPDVTPINDTLVNAVKQRIEQNVELVSPRRHRRYVRQEELGQCQPIWANAMRPKRLSHSCSPT